MDLLSRLIALAAAGFTLLAGAFLAMVLWMALVQFALSDTDHAALLESQPELAFLVWWVAAKEYWGGWWFWLLNGWAAWALYTLTVGAYRKALNWMRGDDGGRRCDECGAELPLKVWRRNDG